MTKKEFMEMGAPKDWNKELGKQMWIEGKNDTEISKAVGVTVGTVNYFRRKHWEPESVAMLTEDGASGVPRPTEDGVEIPEVGADREAAPEPDPVIPEAAAPVIAETKLETMLLRGCHAEDSVPCGGEEEASDEDSLLFAALEEATQNLRGMDAVMTAQIIIALWTWSDPAKLQEAKAFLEYLIGRHAHG